MTSSAKYRSDIDGLRAIAVLAVIIFHALPDALPGGFVGVDIFFVISGFLITQNIARDVQAGHFSYAEFYRRRIKRIMPAMFVTTSIAVSFAQLFMMPEDAESTARSGVWSIFSGANFYFWAHTDTSYFAPESAQLPLLHLWSLGVEEQFYLLWPFALVALIKARESLLWPVVLIAAASFVLGEATADNHPMFAYYLLPTRAGELLLGAAMALRFNLKAPSSLNFRTAMVISILGAVCLVWSFLCLSETDRFPGLLALPPTFGTCLLILGGMYLQNPVAKALSYPSLVGIGLISFSAYLWHWPLLAFYRYAYGEPNGWQALAAIACTLALAYLTYRWVEVPCRRSGARFVRVLLLYSCLPMVVLTVAFESFMLIDGYGLRWFFGPYRQTLAELRAANGPALIDPRVCQNQKLNIQSLADDKCSSDSNAAISQVLLYGDSNAAHFVPMLNSVANRDGYVIQNMEVGACPPIASDPTRFVTSLRVRDCRAASEQFLRAVARYPVVILSASWTTYHDQSADFFTALFTTVKLMVDRGQRVVLIGKVPVVEGFDRHCREKSLTIPGLECSVVTAKASVELVTANDTLQGFAEANDGVEYFDPTPFLCPGGVCSSQDTNGKAIYYDRSHLTPYGSILIGSRIIAGGIPHALALSADRADPRPQ